MDRWLTRFESSWSELGRTVEPGRTLLIGVSGGPDSVALGRLLTELREAECLQPSPAILFGHIHHGLRGVAADADLAFVERFARERGVCCLAYRGDTRALGDLSPEQAARQLRYTQFAVWARTEALGAVLLGHHLNDQAETVLLRAARGTGLRGLAAIPSSRVLEGAPGTWVLRPLLSWRRSEILEYLAERGQEFCQDRTNDDTSIPRNRIRHEVLPALEALQPGAMASLARLAGQARALREELSEAAARVWLQVREQEGSPDGTVVLQLQALHGCPGAVIREVLQLAWEEIAGSSVDPLHGPASQGASTQALVEGLRGERGDARCFLLGGGVRAELRYGKLWLSRTPAGTASTPGQVALDVAAGVPARWGPWAVSVALESGVGDDSIAEAFLEERVDADRVLEDGAPLLRARRTGDRFWPLGAPGAKALKEFFRERRVRPSDREQVPLIVAGEKIVWVVGHRIAHPYRVRAETRRVWTLRAWQ